MDAQMGTTVTGFVELIIQRIPPRRTIRRKGDALSCRIFLSSPRRTAPIIPSTSLDSASPSIIVRAS